MELSRVHKSVFVGILSLPFSSRVPPWKEGGEGKKPPAENWMERKGKENGQIVGEGEKRELEENKKGGVGSL